MIDTIIFDLDGVLIDSKNIHFTALNKALEKTKINYSISLSISWSEREFSLLIL